MTQSIKTVNNYKDLRRCEGQNNTALIALSLFLHAGLIAFAIIGSGPVVDNASDKTDNIISYVVLKKPRPREITERLPEPSPKPIASNTKVTPSDMNSQPTFETKDTAAPPLQTGSLDTVAPYVENSEPKAQSNKTLDSIKNKKLREAPAASMRQELDWNKSENPLIQIQKPFNDERSPQDLTGKNIGFYANGAVHQQAYEDMLQQEIKTYNKLKNSPTIDTIGTVDTRLQITELKPKVIRCEGSVSSSLVMLSKFTGGTVECQQHDIQSFIDKRLDNKEQ